MITLLVIIRQKYFKVIAVNPVKKVTNVLWPLLLCDFFYIEKSKGFPTTLRPQRQKYEAHFYEAGVGFELTG